MVRNNMKRLKLFETAKQWMGHRHGVPKLLTNDTVYEDSVANYVTNPEPTGTPEFQLVPDVLDSDLTDILNWIYTTEKSELLGLIDPPPLPVDITPPPSPCLPVAANKPKLLEVTVSEPFQTHEDTNLTSLTVSNPNTTLTRCVSTRITPFGVDTQGCEISQMVSGIITGLH